MSSVTPTATNITWHQGQVTRAEREALHGHRAAVLWFTGLSGSGKSTLACALERELSSRGCSTYVLDGDNVRYGLNRDLSFAPAERSENIRRVGEVAKLFVDAGVLVLCAFVSPYRADRQGIRELVAPGDFIEVYVQASLEVCRQRDPKGLYRKAESGEIANMTGVGAPYEAPNRPEMVLDTELHTLAESLGQALGFLEEKGYIPARPAASP